ncbi:MAG TPA: ribose-phosphate pyrophosphokinase [Gemmatimonadaceae bacterium]|nr:ribose-phosphate pyrophosphokinase [Gemmatimonadaceae bacterium]
MIEKLKVAELRRRRDPQALGFGNTTDVADVSESGVGGTRRGDESVSAVDRGAPVVLAGPASAALAAGVSVQLGAPLGGCTAERFSDGEVSIHLCTPVRGRAVVLLQATAPPVNDHLMELLAMADACRREAAAYVLAVMPYFGYARSDRRDGLPVPIMGRLVADLLERAGVDEVMTIDVHTPALEGFFRIPLNNRTAVPRLASALRSQLGANAVVVAPDLGAVRLANHYAGLLGTAVAICHKQRISGTEVAVHRITGDVAGRRCVIVDDMIATGGTVVESIRALRAADADPEIAVVATHGIFTPGALQRLRDAGVRDLTVTDTIAQPPASEQPIALRVVPVAPLIAEALR